MSDAPVAKPIVLAVDDTPANTALIPVIFITAKADVEDEQKGSRLARIERHSTSDRIRRSLRRSCRPPPSDA